MIFDLSVCRRRSNIVLSITRPADQQAPEQQAVRFLAEIFANFDNNANRVALGPPGIYDKWVESNKEGVKDEVTYEKREHVKPCLFNAISCPKYPFKYPNKGFK